MSKVIGAETTAKLETQLNGKLIAYWSVTLLLAGSITLSGIGQLMQLGGNIELVTILVIHYTSRIFLGLGKYLESSLSSCHAFLDLKNGLTLVSSF